MFKWGGFKSAAGLWLPFKIDLDGLGDEDWNTLARVVAEETKFGEVEGVPRGGLKLAEHLSLYRGRGPLLIVDDVMTTGGSMERWRNGREAIGVVIFDRSGGTGPGWVRSVFRFWSKK